MYIQEAIKAVNTKDGLYITRRAWTVLYLTESEKYGAPAKLMPTVTPDKFVYVSVTEPHNRPGWQPTVADLLADDWEVCW